MLIRLPYLSKLFRNSKSYDPSALIVIKLEDFFLLNKGNFKLRESGFTYFVMGVVNLLLYSNTMDIQL